MVPRGRREPLWRLEVDAHPVVPHLETELLKGLKNGIAAIGREPGDLLAAPREDILEGDINRGATGVEG
jgi:hypothetical protein